MRTLFLLLLSFFSFRLAAQYDTSLISKAFDYIKTDEFKTALKNYTVAEISTNIQTYRAIRKRANRYKKDIRTRMNFWIINRCLLPENFYFIPDTTGRFTFSDSTVHKKFSKYDYERSSLNCDNRILVTPIFLDHQTIQLHHFFGHMPFGESNIIKLRFVADHFQFVSRGGVIYN